MVQNCCGVFGRTDTGGPPAAVCEDDSSGDLHTCESVIYQKRTAQIMQE